MVVAVQEVGAWDDSKRREGTMRRRRRGIVVVQVEVEVAAVLHACVLASSICVPRYLSFQHMMCCNGNG